MAFVPDGEDGSMPKSSSEFVVHAADAEILVDDAHGSSGGIEHTVQLQGILLQNFFTTLSFSDIEGDAPQPQRLFIFIEYGAGKYLDRNALASL